MSRKKPIPRRNRRRSSAPSEEPRGSRLSRGWGGLSRGAARLYAPLRRPLGLLLRVVVLAAVAALAVAAGRLLERYVRSSPAFATASIEVEGLGRLGREEILETAELALGKNVFEVSPEVARKRLEAHPWVATAEVRRRLPGSYQIEIEERRAVAILALDELLLVADDGGVFKPLEAEDPVDLPIITGVDPEEFHADRLYRSSLLVSAVALLHDYRGAGLWRREPIGEIHLEPGGGFSLYVGHEATQVRLGQRPFREKLRRLRGVLDRLERDQSRAAYVYLDNARRPDRVTVRLR